MTNWERVNEVVSHLRAHPEEHDQGTFGRRMACGTTACMAGRTCLMYAPEKVFWYAFADSVVLQTDGDRPEDRDPAWLACELLDLSPQDANLLFFSCSSLEEIETCLAQMSKREEHEQAVHRG